MQTPVEVKANSETRVDWLVAVNACERSEIKSRSTWRLSTPTRWKRLSPSSSTASRSSFRDRERCAAIVSRSSSTFRKNAAPTRRTLTVQIAPSMATTMLDALPYLIDYPYGCTEQTMSRFLARGDHCEDAARSRSKTGDRDAARSSAASNSQLPQRLIRRVSRDLKELDAITKQSLERLYDFQHPDGGWGWWKEGESDHFMTAYVVWGMTLARQAGIEVKSDVLSSARLAYLDNELVEEEINYDAQAWMLHSLGRLSRDAESKPKSASFRPEAFDNLWTNRDRLNAYTRALLALAAHNYRLCTIRPRRWSRISKTA